MMNNDEIRPEVSEGTKIDITEPIESIVSMLASVKYYKLCKISLTLGRVTTISQVQRRTNVYADIIKSELKGVTDHSHLNDKRKMS